MLKKARNPKELKIVFMGTPEFAVESLRRLVEGGYSICAVITSPDKPAGRGLKLHKSAVKEYAEQVGLPVLQPEKLKDPEFIARLRRYDPDLGIVIAFRMLPEIVWGMPRMGTFNLHASLLPQYRGAAPINRAIMNGETKTGVTTFFLKQEIDTGDILGIREVDIYDEDTAGTLHDKLMYEGAGLVIETVDRIAAGNAVPQRQNDAAELRTAPKIFREDCRIDWSALGLKIYNLIRGLSPYPAAWTTMVDLSECTVDDMAVGVKIYGAGFIPEAHDYPAGSIHTDGKTYLDAACRDGFIRIKVLQLTGKKKLAVDEFLRGFKNVTGFTFL